ncbi:MAG TPA: Ig-like domain-containing protein [Bacteroidia bacterium]|nr:Ig-like domain-containing protein [Bacteroidia bacterium]
MIFFSPGCKKKKEDTIPPLVSISNPVSGQAFNMFDTITVTAHVSDETQLTSVVVSLNDGNNIPVQSAVSISIQSKNFTFTLKYPLTEYHLTSGNYYISIIANDGSNSHQSTTQVYVTESPTLKTGYFITGISQPKNIGRYDVNFNPTGNISLNTGFNGMAYAGYYRQLYVNGNINQSFQAFYEPTSSPVWSGAYGGGGLPQDMAVFTNGREPYISYYSGYVISYSNNGTTDKTYKNANNTYYASRFCFGSSYNLGIYKDKLGTATDKIISFGKNTGIAFNSNFAPCSVVTMFPHTDDEFYVLGNNTANNVQLYLYTVSANVFAGPLSLPAGKLLSAAQIDPDYLVFSLDNANIYGYRYSTGNTLSLANIAAQKLFYHPKMYELTVAASKTLYVYPVTGSYALGTASSHIFSDSITAFEVITNK